MFQKIFSAQLLKEQGGFLASKNVNHETDNRTVREMRLTMRTAGAVGRIAEKIIPPTFSENNSNSVQINNSRNRSKQYPAK
jgi:hypothetical protein